MASKYPVKRGSRWDRLSLDVVRDWTIEGMNELDGNPDDAKLIDRTPLFIMGHMETEAIEMYSRIVVYTANNGSGKRPQLKNLEGETFTIPLPDASRAQLAIGYGQWMKLDEMVQEEIDIAIIELNKPPAPRHILPPDQLTEQEKADPNSKGEGKKTKRN
jgi:hypothetical protein